MKPDPRQLAQELMERGLEGAHEHQADYYRIRRDIFWVRVGIALLALAMSVIVYFVATTARSADERSAGTQRFLEGKQGRPGKPGEGGPAGLRGPGPTPGQLAVALRKSCGGSCKGKTGARGRPGADGKDGLPGNSPTVAEVLRAARAACANGACRGERGRDPTPKEIIGAVAVYCEAVGCDGKAGKDGRDGKDGAPVRSWVFTDGSGQTQLCADPDGDLAYECMVIASGPVGISPPPPPAVVPPPVPPLP